MALFQENKTCAPAPPRRTVWCPASNWTAPPVSAHTHTHTVEMSRCLFVVPFTHTTRLSLSQAHWGECVCVCVCVCFGPICCVLGFFSLHCALARVVLACACHRSQRLIWAWQLWVCVWVKVKYCGDARVRC